MDAKKGWGKNIHDCSKYDCRNEYNKLCVLSLFTQYYQRKKFLENSLMIDTFRIFLSIGGDNTRGGSFAFNRLRFRL